MVTLAPLSGKNFHSTLSVGGFNYDKDGTEAHRSVISPADKSET